MLVSNPIPLASGLVVATISYKPKARKHSLNIMCSIEVKDDHFTITENALSNSAAQLSQIRKIVECPITALYCKNNTNYQ